MTRAPYALPQTSMERHVAQLVEHLRSGVDSIGGFAQKVESAQAHAYWLETECARLRAEVRKMENELCVGLPTITMDWSNTEIPIRPYVTYEEINWEISPIRYRVRMTRQQLYSNEETWGRIRRWTFRAFVQKLREEYERCVPLRLPHHMIDNTPPEKVG